MPTARRSLFVGLEVQRRAGVHQQRGRGSHFPPVEDKCRLYAGACERARDITRVDATWNAARRDEGLTLDLHKIFVYFEAVVHESTILSPPPRPPALPTLV